MLKIELVANEYRHRVFEIYENCRLKLTAKNINQWNTSYPSLELIEDDILNSNLYALYLNKEILGIICINTIQEKEYKGINWKDLSNSNLVIHRLAVDPRHQGKSYAHTLMDFAESYALKNGFSSIRLDAYSANLTALNFYTKRGYTKRGEVFFYGRHLPFYCYEKKKKKLTLKTIINICQSEAINERSLSVHHFYKAGSL